jgi:hypothetical protein
VEIETTTSEVSSPDPRSFSIHLMCHTGAVCFPGVWLQIDIEALHLYFIQHQSYLIQMIGNFLKRLQNCNQIKKTVIRNNFQVLIMIFASSQYQITLDKF